MKCKYFLILLLITPLHLLAYINNMEVPASSEKTVRNGIPWHDDQGNIVNAHGACIVEEDGRYYLFGEWKSDESNAFPGFSCYSSTDLVNWKFENVVLPVQKYGILGPNRVGERVKVMKCPSTGEYVMYMHADDMGYRDPHIGYATSKTIAGDYEFHGPLLYKGEPIRRWDMGTFQDSDGKGYLLIHHGIIYRLSDDYRSAESKILDGLKNSGESPAMFKKDGLYYMLCSGLTSWEKNDNFYFTAPSIEGPWKEQGLFAPEGSLTYNSQTTFVFPLVRGNDTIPMFMGDRWSFPHQASAATYVWIPLQVDGEKISIPEYWENWNIETVKPVERLMGRIPIDVQNMKFSPSNEWKINKQGMVSNVKGSTVEIPFKGTRVAITGETNNRSGYARVTIRNNAGESIYSSLVDFYTKYTTTGTRYLSPVLPEGEYVLTIEVTGISPVWTDKSKTIYGSTDSYVTINEIAYFESQNNNPVHVIITAGQSNTDGRVDNRLLPDYIKSFATDMINYQKGEYPYCKISQNRHDGQFVPYWPKGRITEGLWTYDAVTYYNIGQALKEDFYVVKWAVGGTSIGFPNDTTKGRFWSANPEWLSKTESYENGGNSLLLSFTEAIDASIDQTLSKLDEGYQIDAFLWHQGESDDKYAEDYYGNLKAVINHVRNHLTEKTGKDYSRLPFIFGSIPKENRNYRPLIESAMQRIAEEDSDVYLIDMSKGELQRDRTHFNEKSAEYLGNQMYKILDRIVGYSKSDFRIAKYRGNKECAISYTFDDGLKEHYTTVAPRFEELGFRGTFWVNGSKVNLDKDNISDKTRVTWAELREMSDDGHEISNHGWVHMNFGRHTLDEIKRDVFINDGAIYAHTGKMPLTFCYPNNTKTAEGVMLVSENRVGTRLVQRSIGSKSTSENLDVWVNNLLQAGDWGVGMTHGITYGYDHFTSADIFWEHLKKVKARENKIWVGTFREVSAYQKAWKSITYDILETDDGMLIIPHLTLDKELFNEPLTGVIDRAGIKNITVVQGDKELQTQIFTDKVIFDFDPHGGAIEIII